MLYEVITQYSAKLLQKYFVVYHSHLHEKEPYDEFANITVRYIDLPAIQSLFRITSYNVCYTKLLRALRVVYTARL